MNAKFTIECEMEERWVPHFMGMLAHMQHIGNIGASEMLAFFADGDGDFNPRFVYDFPETTIPYHPGIPMHARQPIQVDRLFDAG